MKTRNRSPKTRPVLALLIFVGTLFLLAGRSCGVVGALLSASVERLLGGAGTGLLVVTAWALAFILATPAGTLTRMVVSLWRACVTPRHTPAVVVMKTRAPEPRFLAPGERVHPFMNAAPEPATLTVVRNAGAASPRDRMALQDVATALKGLGYVKHEIEPLVAQMDPAAGFEKNVKSALKALRVN